jgi:hypothetical protein
MGGVPIPVGTVAFTPVNAMGIPIPFTTGGGGLNSPMAFSCTITSGAITGTCQVPDAALTIPANILYSIQIRNTASQQAFTLQSVPNVTGSTWALDEYAPPAQMTHVQTVQASIGATVPTSCVMPSVFTKTSAPTGLYYCVGGTFVPSGGVYTGTAPIVVSGSAISIQTATDSVPGAMSATDHAALTAVQVKANAALPASGGTMTGPLVLAADPTAASQAATKNYVDTHTSSAVSTITYASTLPGITPISAIVAGSSSTGAMDNATALNTALASGITHLVIDGKYAVGSTLKVPSNVKDRMHAGEWPHRACEHECANDHERNGGEQPELLQGNHSRWRWRIRRQQHLQPEHRD